MLSSMKSLYLISIERQTISNELLLNWWGGGGDNMSTFWGPCLHLIEAISFYLGGGGSFSDIEFTMVNEANNELPFLRRSHKERHFMFQHPACIGKKNLHWYIHELGHTGIASHREPIKKD